MFSRIKKKLAEYRRVIKVAIKPTKDEFVVSVKVVAIGVAIIGIIGLGVQIIFWILLPGA